MPYRAASSGRLTSSAGASAINASSSSESFTTSASTSARSMQWRSWALSAHKSWRILGSKLTNPPAPRTRSMALKVVEREGSAASAIEQQCSHSPRANGGRSVSARNRSALGRTIKVKERSPSSSSATTTVEVRCCASARIKAVSTCSFASVWRIKWPKGSSPTRPIKPLSPCKRAMPTATLAGAPPGHCIRQASPCGNRSTTASPRHQTRADMIFSR